MPVSAWAGSGVSRWLRTRWPGPRRRWPRARWPGPRVVVRCGEDSTPANCRSVRIRFDSVFDSAFRTGGYFRESSGSKHRRSRSGLSGSRAGRLRPGRAAGHRIRGRRRPPGPGAQAADQGGSGRRDRRRGAGPDGQGGRADGQVRHRPGAARRAAAGDRSPRRPEGGHRQPVGPGPGPPALRRGGRDAVPVRAAPPARPGDPHPHLRVRLRHRAHRRALHVAAAADVAGPGHGPDPWLEPQPARVAAQLAARLHLGRGLPGPGRRAGCHDQGHLPRRRGRRAG